MSRTPAGATIDPTVGGRLSRARGAHRTDRGSATLELAILTVVGISCLPIAFELLKARRADAFDADNQINRQCFA